MSVSDRPWVIDTTPDKVPTLRTSIVNTGTAAQLLFIGDLHWDHAKADRKAIKTVLDQALERDAAIVLLGDALCLMQGRDDRRSTKGALRPAHATDTYFNTVVDDWCEWFAPYAGNTWIALEGNHCSAVRTRHEIDVTRMWVGRLNAAGARIEYPGYSTYARVTNVSSTRRSGLRFFVHHGYGGGGPVTRGTIQAQRRAVMYPDANWIVTGHIHSSYAVDHEQYRLDHQGRPYVSVQEHYSVGAWKDEYGDGQGGWWVEKGMGPRQKSGWWCQLRYSLSRRLTWSFEKAVP